MPCQLIIFVYLYLCIAFVNSLDLVNVSNASTCCFCWQKIVLFVETTPVRGYGGAKALFISFWHKAKFALARLQYFYSCQEIVSTWKIALSRHEIFRTESRLNADLWCFHLKWTHSHSMWLWSFWVYEYSHMCICLWHKCGVRWIVGVANTSPK